MEKKRILIYGDSNTHGFDVRSGLRFSPEQRWTGACQHIVGETMVILEEGLNGRTTCHDESGMEFRNGLAYIEPCVRTHLPLDLCCVMLGSNDLKGVFHQSAPSIAENAARVLLRAKEVALSKYPDSPCKYLLMSPPEVTEKLLSSPFAPEFEGMKTVEKSRQFSRCFAEAASRYGFLFFDAAAWASPGEIDGLHLDEKNHRLLGEAFGRWLMEAF